jgi:hypothetical protein
VQTRSGGGTCLTSDGFFVPLSRPASGCVSSAMKWLPLDENNADIIGKRLRYVRSFLSNYFFGLPAFGVSVFAMQNNTPELSAILLMINNLLHSLLSG